MCAVVLLDGFRTTSGLSWPGDPDLYRDIAQATTFIQGDWLGDPYYLTGRLWYNPLVPRLVAALSKLSGVPVPVLYTHAGVYLNLLAPLAFFALIASWFDRRVALAAVAAFLFLRRLPAWAAATYSPWLFAGVFSQTLFYLGLLALLRAYQRDRYRDHVLFGFVLGLVFLGHTAPALILGVTATVLALGKLRTRTTERPRRSFLRLGLSLAVAGVVSLPFLYTIVGIYHLRVVNAVPTTWLWRLLEWRHLGDLLVAQFWPVTLVALLGLMTTWRRERHRPETTILFAWGGTALLGLGLGYARQLLEGQMRLPAVVPSFHFLFYLKGLEAVFFGLGLVALVTAISRWLPVMRRTSAVSLVVLLMLILIYPQYEGRHESRSSRVEAEARERRFDLPAVTEWIEAHAPRDAVFLCSDELALYVVGPSGRKVLVVDPFFSNPFLDWRVRDRRRRQLLGYLESDDMRNFRRLARRHRVTHVLMRRGDEERLGPEATRRLRTVFAQGELVVARIRRGAAQ